MTPSASLEVSVVVPTIGRIEMLDACLRSLLACSPRAPRSSWSIRAATTTSPTSSRDSAATRAPLREHRAWDQPRDERGARGRALRPRARHARRLRRRDRLGRPRRVLIWATDRTSSSPGRVEPGTVGIRASCRRCRPTRRRTTSPASAPAARCTRTTWRCRRAAVSHFGGFDERLWFAEDNDLSYRWLLVRTRTPLRAGHGGLAPRLADEGAARRGVYVEYWHSQGVFYAKHLLRRDRAMVGFLAEDAHQAARYGAARLLGRARPWSDDRSGIWRGLPVGLARRRPTVRATPMPDTRADPTALLIVSPHLDDAVLSCFALLTGPTPADVLTVFAGAPVPPRVAWSERAMGFADSDATMSCPAHRGRPGAGGAHASHRHHGSSRRGLHRRTAARPADADGPAYAVSAWVAGNPRGRVTVPAGAGRVLGRVRRPARASPRGPGQGHAAPRPRVRPRRGRRARRTPASSTSCCSTRSCPTCGTAGDGGVAPRRAAHARRPSRKLELRVDRDAKASRIACYASQLDHLGARRSAPEDPAALPPVERYALLTSRAAVTMRPRASARVRDLSSSGCSPRQARRALRTYVRPVWPPVGLCSVRLASPADPARTRVLGPRRADRPLLHRAFPASAGRSGRLRHRRHPRPRARDRRRATTR